jgi:hypothetical protein
MMAWSTNRCSAGKPSTSSSDTRFVVDRDRFAPVAQHQVLAARMRHDVDATIYTRTYRASWSDPFDRFSTGRIRPGWQVSMRPGERPHKNARYRARADRDARSRMLRGSTITAWKRSSVAILASRRIIGSSLGYRFSIAYGKAHVSSQFPPHYAAAPRRPQADARSENAPPARPLQADRAAPRPPATARPASPAQPSRQYRRCNSRARRRDQRPKPAAPALGRRIERRHSQPW